MGSIDNSTNFNTYGDDSIDMLVGAARVRTRPASMLGSDGLDGARHGFTELYGNALDERSAGYGDKLDVILFKDGSIAIRDYGRGVPLGWNKKWNAYNWHVVYNEMYGGGKYDNGQWYLASVDKDSQWAESGDEFKKLNVAMIKEFGVDLSTIPADDMWRTYRDLNIKHKSTGGYSLRVNNESWATLTAEKLLARLNYLFSVGLNGLGAASTQYTSTFFHVISIRKNEETGKNEKTEMEFKNGLPVINGVPTNVHIGNFDHSSYKQEVVETDEPTGTYIHWLPDDTVFSDTNIGGDWLYNVCKDITGVAGIDLHFEDQQTGKVADLKAGTLDTLLADRCGVKLLDSNILTSSALDHGSTIVNKEDFIWLCKTDVAIAFTKHHVDHVCFHNSVRMNSGVQYSAVNQAISDFFANIGRLQGIKFDPRDYQDSISVAVSSYSNYASFRGQTKDGVDNDFISRTVYNTVYSKLTLEHGKKNKVLAQVIETAITEANARMAAKEAAKLVRESQKTVRLKEPDKFVSCHAYENKDYENAELWITEGDSAKGAVVSARDRKTQAVYPIRGKGINVLKVGIDKVLANKEIKEIFALLGTGFDLNLPDVQLFSIDKLRFGKIIFATDADEDGYQIRVLLYLTFYKLAPELLKQGKVFIAESPRFKIDLSNGKSIYARNDEERDKILKKYTGQIRNVQRFKGLGEVNADVLRETTVAPETRNLIPLTIDLENDMERDFIDALFGQDKFKQRKEILTAALGTDVADMFEENALLLESIDEMDIDEDTDIITV